MIRRSRRTSKTAFTLVELLVVVAILCLLLAILTPSLSRAKEMGRRIVCCSNLRQFSHAMGQYHAAFKMTFPGHKQDGAGTRIWVHDLYQFAGVKELGRCPGIRGEQIDFGYSWNWAWNQHLLGYGYNAYFLGHYCYNDAAPEYGERPHINGVYIRPYNWFKTTRVMKPWLTLVFSDSNPSPGGWWSTSLWWPKVESAKEGVTNRHLDAGCVSFADGHAQVFLDPANTINPKHPSANNCTPNLMEYWDPLQRKP